jgi:hypothetical protein
MGAPMVICALLHEAANRIEAEEPCRILDARDLREWARILDGWTPDEVEYLLSSECVDPFRNLDRSVAKWKAARAAKQKAACR